MSDLGIYKSHKERAKALVYAMWPSSDLTLHEDAAYQPDWQKVEAKTNATIAVNWHFDRKISEYKAIAQANPEHTNTTDNAIHFANEERKLMLEAIDKL